MHPGRSDWSLHDRRVSMLSYVDHDHLVRSIEKAIIIFSSKVWKTIQRCKAYVVTKLALETYFAVEGVLYVHFRSYAQRKAL